MHLAAASLNRIVSSVKELRQRCSAASSELKKRYNEAGKPLVFSVQPAAISTAAVAAVDSGFSVRQFVSVDVMLLRSVGCVFHYTEGKLASTSFYPSRVPEINIHSGVFAEQVESAAFRSLTRLNAELNCALQIAKIYSPKMLLIDGSLLPLASDKPSAGSGLENLYEETVQLYKQLFTFSENGVEIAGIVKDPRSQRLCSIISGDYPQIAIPSSDAFLCDSLLAPLERTVTFAYADDATATPVLRDLAEWSNRVKAFYLKAGNDIPYRVEFISSKAVNAAAGEIEIKASSIAGKLTSLGSRHVFAYPSILIEADMRAALTPQEINAVYSSLSARSMLAELRSNSRPFR